jgi:hypothetical protein
MIVRDVRKNTARTERWEGATYELRYEMGGNGRTKGAMDFDWGAFRGRCFRFSAHFTIT